MMVSANDRKRTSSALPAMLAPGSLALIGATESVRQRRSRPTGNSVLVLRPPQLAAQEIGKIMSVSTGIARVSGLPNVGFEELLRFPDNRFGIAFNVDEDEIGVVLLGEYQGLHAGDEVERTGRVMDVAVGDCSDA